MLVTSPTCPGDVDIPSEMSQPSDIWLIALAPDADLAVPGAKMLWEFLSQDERHRAGRCLP